MAEEKYQRLTRVHPRTQSGVGLTAYSSLWLGSDHLLCIDTNGYTEKYKRFYFRDIQAVVLRRTNLWIGWAAIFGGLSMLFGLMALSSGEVSVNWVFGILAGAFLLAMVLDLVAGPTCVCQLRTAVQTEELAGLGRVRRAQRVLGRLRPLLAQVQGEEIASQDIPTWVRDWQVANAPFLTPPASGSPLDMFPAAAPAIEDNPASPFGNPAPTSPVSPATADAPSPAEPQPNTQLQ